MDLGKLFTDLVISGLDVGGSKPLEGPARTLTDGDALNGLGEAGLLGPGRGGP